jgi:hypothetical protein
VADASCCDSLCTTFPAATCNLAACGGCPAGGPCDNRLGTGKVTDKTGDDCSIEGGRRYMLDTQADLDETFACVAEVGTKGSGNEQTMEAMGNAISPGLNADGACNDGFVRDDALLVIVIITDEEDDHETVSSGYAGFGSNGDPVHWYDFVVDVKGDPKHAAVLSLVGPAGADACSPLDKENGDAIDGAEVAHRILEFTEMFPFGFVGPVCAPNYNSFFEEAVEIVKEACDAFDQPG